MKREQFDNSILMMLKEESTYVLEKIQSISLVDYPKMCEYWGNILELFGKESKKWKLFRDKKTMLDVLEAIALDSIAMRLNLLAENRDVVKMKDIYAMVNHMGNVFEKKNADYGNAFEESIKEDGILVAKIRLGDKIRRLSNLLKGNDIKVKEEGIDDTLLDLANYSVMTYTYLKN